MKGQEVKRLWSAIEEIPFRPRNVKEPLGTVVFSLLDIPAYIFQNKIKHFPLFPQIPPFYYPYKRGKFSKKGFKIKNSLQLQTVIGERENNRKTVILVHGIFQSKNFRFIRNIADRLYSDFGFDVIVIDIRDHLETGSLFPEFPISSGFLEGKDILEIASQVKRKNKGQNIFLIGFSYGGGIVLNTLNSSEAKDVISGVIAISPTMILEHAVRHIDTNPGVIESFYPMYSLFQLCLRLRYGVSIKTFDEYIEKSAKRYGSEKKVMMTRSSVTEFINRIEVPTLIIVSKDDPVIPEGDIEEVIKQSRFNENIKVMVQEKGGHIAFSFIAPVWFYKVIDAFVGSTSLPS